MDVQSFSYKTQSYKTFHEKTPWKSVGGGEGGSCHADRGEWANGPKGSGHMGAYSGNNGPRYDCGLPGVRQTGTGYCNLFDCLEGMWSPIASQHFVYGGTSGSLLP